MNTSKLHDQRFIVSDDALFVEWIAAADLANYPGWHDCTEMDDEEFQRFIAERQAVRPHIVGMAV